MMMNLKMKKRPLKKPSQDARWGAVQHQEMHPNADQPGVRNPKIDHQVDRYLN